MKRKVFAATALAVAGVLSLAACQSGSPSDKANPTATADYTVQKNVDIKDSPTYDKIKQAGKITIGVKEDQPGLGYLDQATDKRSGFDIEMAKWMAASLGIDEKNIEWKTIPSANRESAIANGDVNLYVGTYSITDARKQQVSFAGPYFVTGQGLLVQKKNSDIKSEADLKGKTVCSATGSTPLQNIQKNFPDTKAVSFDTYSQCVDQLKQGKVDAVTTDQAILIGYASNDPDNLKVVGKPFTTEKYGIGLPKDDNSLRSYLNKTLTDGNKTWKSIYDQTLGKSGTKVEQPKVEE